MASALALQYNVGREIVSVATFHLRQTRGLADTQAQHPPFVALGSSFRIQLLIASFQGCQRVLDSNLNHLIRLTRQVLLLHAKQES